MFRGTTPTLTYKLNTDIDLTDIVQIWVTLSDGVNQITKDINDVIIDNVEHTVQVKLSQEDTLLLNGGSKAKTQIRLLDGNDNAYASSIKEVMLNSILKDGVIANDN